MKPFDYNKIEDSSLEKEMNPLLFKGIDSPYTYNGVEVPRVTSILSDMLHEEYLMGWANYMGRIKHMDHRKYTEEAAYIGTRVHHAIEYYLKGIANTEDTSFNDITDISIRNACNSAFLSFKRWWAIIMQHKYKILLQEESLVCPYYAGTLDLYIEIDGRKYLVDFKTSNHFNYKYHLQTAAYRRLLYYKYGFITDGIIILRLSKNNVSFEEQTLDLSNYDMLQYINDCDKCFQSLVYAYYNRFTVTQHYTFF